MHRARETGNRSHNITQESSLEDLWPPFYNQLRDSVSVILELAESNEQFTDSLLLSPANGITRKQDRQIKLKQRTVSVYRRYSQKALISTNLFVTLPASCPQSTLIVFTVKFGRSVVYAVAVNCLKNPDA